VAIAFDSSAGVLMATLHCLSRMSHRHPVLMSERHADVIGVGA